MEFEWKDILVNYNSRALQYEVEFNVKQFQIRDFRLKEKYP